jgi:hypothetical protein
MTDFNSPAYTPATPVNRGDSFDLPSLMPYEFTGDSLKSQDYSSEFGMYHSPPSTPANFNFKIHNNQHRNSSFSLASNLSGSPALMPSSPPINDLSMLQSPYHYPLQSSSLSSASTLIGSPLEQYYTVQDFLTSPAPSSPGFTTLDDPYASSSCSSPQFLPNLQDMGLLSGSPNSNLESAAKKTKKRSSSVKKRTNSSDTFQCPYPQCDRIFNQAHNLKSHMICHSGERPFGCTSKSCNATFRRKHELHRHFQTSHSNIRPHVCELCGRGFSRRDHYKRHVVSKVCTK